MEKSIKKYKVLIYNGEIEEESYECSRKTLNLKLENLDPKEVLTVIVKRIQ